MHKIPLHLALVLTLAMPLLSSSLGQASEERSAKNKTLVIDARTQDGKPYKIYLKRVRRKNLEKQIAEQVTKNASHVDGTSKQSLYVVSPNSGLADEAKKITESLNLKNVEVKRRKIDFNLARQVKTRFQKAFPKVQAHDVWMATALLPLSAGASMASYYLTDTPLSLSLLISIGAGIYASGFQLYVEYWKDYINKSRTWLGKLAKFHFTEVAFLTIPPAVFLAAGHTAPKGFIEYVYLLGQINLISLWPTLTQGYLEKELVDLERADQKRGIHRQFLGVSFTNFGFLAASTVSIFSALSALSAQQVHGAQTLQYLSYIGFGSLVAGGYALYYYRTKRFLPNLPFMERIFSRLKKNKGKVSIALRCESVIQ